LNFGLTELRLLCCLFFPSFCIFGINFFIFFLIFVAWHGGAAANEREEAVVKNELFAHVIGLLQEQLQSFYLLA
jgi:hypothetical protein